MADHRNSSFLRQSYHPRWQPQFSDKSRRRKQTSKHKTKGTGGPVSHVSFTSVLRTYKWWGNWLLLPLVIISYLPCEAWGTTFKIAIVGPWACDPMYSKALPDMAARLATSRMNKDPELNKGYWYDYTLVNEDCTSSRGSMMRSVEGCWFLGDVVCKVHSSLDVTLCVSSILHLGLISIDRYWAICDPLRYKMRITNKIVTVCITFMWLFSFTYSFSLVFSGLAAVGLEMFVMQVYCVGSCVLLFNKEWGLTSSLLTLFFPGTIMSSLYMKIFHVAKKHAKVMSVRVTVRATGVLKSQSSAQRERKAAKTLAIVMGVFYLCWLPYSTVALIDPFLNFIIPADVFDALTWFAYFNATCNPFIYGFFYPRFQKAFKILISTFICGFEYSDSLIFE